MRTIQFIFLLFAIATPYSAVSANSTLHVMLQEWRIIADKKVVPAGPLKISVQNRGQETHEIVLLRTDLPHNNLPMQASGGISEEKAGKLVNELEDLTPRSKKSMHVNLKPGNYVLLCNMVEIEDGEKEQHYSMGMRTAFTVR